MPIVTLPASSYPSTPIAQAISTLGQTYLSGVQTPEQIANAEGRKAFLAAQTRRANAAAGVDEGKTAGRAKAAGAVVPGQGFDVNSAAGLIQGLLASGDTSNLGNILLAAQANLNPDATPDQLVRARTGAGLVTKPGEGVTAADREAQGAIAQANEMAKVGLQERSATDRQRIASGAALAGDKYRADRTLEGTKYDADRRTALGFTDIATDAETARRGQDVEARTARRGQDVAAQTASELQAAKDRNNPSEMSTLAQLMIDAGIDPKSPEGQDYYRRKLDIATSRAEGSPPAPASVDAGTLESIVMGAYGAVPGATFVPEGGKDPIVDPDFEKQLNPQKVAAAKVKAAQVYQQTKNVALAQQAFMEAAGIPAGSTFSPAQAEVPAGWIASGKAAVPAALNLPATAGPAAAPAPAAPALNPPYGVSPSSGAPAVPGNMMPMSAPPPSAQRVAGKVYQTPKGPMLWTGTGWKPAGGGA